MQVKVPKDYRSGGYLTPCIKGISLPCWFLDDLQSIDKDIYPIWHPVEILYDDFMNKYEGNPDDPRFVIGVPSGFSEEIWGYPTKQAKSDSPVLDGSWHLWRACHSVGAWAHIACLASRDPEYLQFVLGSLNFQARFSSKYGHRALNQFRRERLEKERQQELSNRQNLFCDVNKANKRLITSAIDNMERGVLAPTKPTKEIIRSYNDQKHHTKIIRPLTDREGGLIVPSDWEKN